jgi:hypothetical protein
MEQWTIALTPLVIWGVTYLIQLFPLKWNAVVIVGIVVPILSAISVWLLGLVQPGLIPWQQFTFNFLAVFVNELVKQLRQLKS